MFHKHGYQLEDHEPHDRESTQRKMRHQVLAPPSVESGNDGSKPPLRLPAGMTSRRAPEELATKSWKWVVLRDEVTNS